MIITLRAECIYGAYHFGECVRVIEISEDASLTDLHCAIQKAVQFGDDHLYEFYAGKSLRKRAFVFDRNSYFDHDEEYDDDDYEEDDEEDDDEDDEESNERGQAASEITLMDVLSPAPRNETLLPLRFWR